MKKFLFIVLCICFISSCIKKKAIKAEPDLVGTWVAHEGGYFTWLIISPDGHGIYRTYDYIESKDSKYDGETKYSLFESKLYVGITKFHVLTSVTGKTDGVEFLDAKDFATLNSTTFHVDHKMVLKTSILHGSRTINFFKVAN